MIGIIENEFEPLRAPFNIAFQAVFGQVPAFDIFTASQDFQTHINNCPYNFLFVDIELSAQSSQDGLEIIGALLNNGYPREKICVLTGYLDAGTLIKERGLPNLKVLTKPTSYKEIIPILRSIP